MIIYYCIRFETHPIFLYPPGTGWPNYTSKHWVPFSTPPTTRRATVEVFEFASTMGLANNSAVFRFLRYSLCAEPQRTPLPTFPLLLHGYLLLWERGANYTENTTSCVVIVLFHSNSCLCWLHKPGFQHICHNIMRSFCYTLTQIYYGEVAVCVVVCISGVHC
jgi:hypothetical protein